jgi:hypothetical protein
MSVIRMRGYPKWFYHMLIVSFTVLVLSGLALIPNMLLFRLDWDVAWFLPEAKRLWLVAIHVLVAFLVISQLGALWSVHMRIGWRHHKNMGSGIIMVVVLVALTITGVGIYYLGESLTKAASLSHLLIGLCFPCLLVYHIIAGRTRYKLH